MRMRNQAEDLYCTSVHSTQELASSYILLFILVYYLICIVHFKLLSITLVLIKGYTKERQVFPDNHVMCLTDKVLEAWAESSDVTPQTLRFLKEEGFTSMRMLSRLTPDEIDKAFQGPRLLPLAQCLALKEAVKKLTGETAAPAPAPAPASPPAPAPAPAPVPAPAFAPEAPDRREQENLVGWRPAEFQVFTTRGMVEGKEQ